MPSYIPSSSIFGSIIIILTCSGLDLYIRLKIIEFIATDFPDPVVPATNKCGILAKSVITGAPDISFPKPIVSFEENSSNAKDLRISDNLTICLLSFGISMPITFFPGITSTTLTFVTDNALARSFDKFVIFPALTPASGSNSNIVITGP